EDRSHRGSGGAVQDLSLGLNGSAAKGTLSVARGGTSFDSYAAGDILVGTAAGGMERRGIGHTNDVFTVSDGTPQWASITSIAQGGNDARYVNASGDTMTGALAIVLDGLGLSVRGIASGATLHA